MAKKHPTQGFRKTSMFSQLSHRLYFHTGEGIPNESLEGVRIVRENGRWFVIVPQPDKPSQHRLWRSIRVCEPSCLCMVSVSTATSGVAISVAGRLCHHLDDLMGRKSKGEVTKAQPEPCSATITLAYSRRIAQKGGLVADV